MDPMGEATAKMNISDLKKVLGLPESPDSNENNANICNETTQFDNGTLNNRIQRVRRESMEQLDLFKVVMAYLDF